MITKDMTFKTLFNFNMYNTSTLVTKVHVHSTCILCVCTCVICYVPPTGSLGEPVTNWMNCLCSVVLYELSTSNRNCTAWLKGRRTMYSKWCIAVRVSLLVCTCMCIKITYHVCNHDQDDNFLPILKQRKCWWTQL